MSEREKIAESLSEKYNTLLLSKKEAACEIGHISQATLDRLRQSGQLSSKKVLGQIRFSVMEIARFIADA